MQLAELTDPEQPWTRRAFSERHAQGRQWLAGRMRELGLLTSIDAAGEMDLGNIDVFENRSGEYHLEGNWGKVTIAGPPPVLEDWPDSIPQDLFKRR